MAVVFPCFANPRHRFKDEAHSSKEIIKIGKAGRKYYIEQWGGVDQVDPCVFGS